MCETATEPNHRNAYIETIAESFGLPRDDFTAMDESTKRAPVLTHYVPQDELEAVRELADTLRFDTEVVEEYDAEVLLKAEKRTEA